MPSSGERRPQPEALLEAARREKRGRLKVFLGAAPGVGKTYTMLENARVRAGAEVDVVVGVVETHGRTETAELLLGLEIFPRRSVEYRGITLDEMDLEGLLARRPQLALVDELAHTNAPGSRHAKRYQDVEELLEAGINVYTTLNIQHLESLNDAVAQITGVRVRETVPDRLLERADEVEVVDLSVDEHLERLRQGKVYLPETAARATQNYFRPGNLQALRQLALRTAAERADLAMQGYMQEHAIPGPWPATERLLVSVGPSPLSPRLVRATRRLAERRHAEWIALYVETPRHQRLSEEDRNRIASTLRLAEELGGVPATTSGERIADALLDYARRNNITEIVVGKSLRPWWFELLRGSIVRDLIAQSGAIDVYVVAGEKEESVGGETVMPPPRDQPRPMRRIIADLAMWVAVATIAARLLRMASAETDLSLIFLIPVLVVAVRHGLVPAIATSVVAVMAYDFFCVEPFYTFTVTRPDDILALVIFVIGAVLAGNLTARVRAQAATARRREEETTQLYALGSAVAATDTIEATGAAVAEHLGRFVAGTCVLFLPDGTHLKQSAAWPHGTTLTNAEEGTPRWVWHNNRAAGYGTGTLPGDRWLSLPLRVRGTVIGVVALLGSDGPVDLSPDARRTLDLLVDRGAVALEHVRLTGEIEEARIRSERERLQAILLSSISHDLRTPLASIIGGASALLEERTHYDEATRRDLLMTIQEEAERLNRFVGNMLDSSRLESGAMTLNREWWEIGEVIAAARAQLAHLLAAHTVVSDVPATLPPVCIDAVLMAQVMVNLLENAARYSDPGTTITVHASAESATMRVEVEDEGIGIPADELEQVFDRFYRVLRTDRQRAGTGLGLAICRGIVEMHGGTITASSPLHDGHGTRITVHLPIDPGGPDGEERTA